MTKLTKFEHEAFCNESSATLLVQLPLPGLEEYISALGADDHATISNMWEPEPVGCIPPSDGVDREI